MANFPSLLASAHMNRHKFIYRLSKQFLHQQPALPYMRCRAEENWKTEQILSVVYD